jgi:hypothetical protein
MFRFTNWISKQKALQQRIPMILRGGVWLMMALYQLAGVYAMVLTTVGRKSGRPREVVIVGTKLGEGFAVVAPFGKIPTGT